MMPSDPLGLMAGMAFGLLCVKFVLWLMGPMAEGAITRLLK